MSLLFCDFFVFVRKLADSVFREAVRVRIVLCNSLGCVMVVFVYSMCMCHKGVYPRLAYFFNYLFFNNIFCVYGGKVSE